MNSKMVDNLTFQTFSSRYLLKCDREIAYESPDHIMPWGTSRDNSKNQRFNNKLYKLYGSLTHPLRVLDIGCSGGGFVKNCIDDGCLAIGLEGSDYSKRLKRAEWRTIPESLFTCDATANFEILCEQNGEMTQAYFDVVTSWEFIEHIAENDLPKVAENVKRHLADSGLWIMSVSTIEDVINGVRLHQTVKPKSWWIKKVEEWGLEHLEGHVDYFNTQFVRGPKYGGPGSFILILAKKKACAPAIPNLPPFRKFFEYLYDKWLGSFPQKVLRIIVVGDIAI